MRRVDRQAQLAGSVDPLDAIERFKAAVAQVYFDTNEAIVRTCQEAGWPAPTPTQITRVVQG